MKRQRLFPIVPLALALAVAIILFIRERQERTPAAGPAKANPARVPALDTRHSAPAPDTQPQPKAAVSETGVGATNAVVAAPVKLDKVVSIEGGSQDQIVRVPAAKALAKVNGATITLSDLLPLKASEATAEQIMSPETFRFLLDRAINRELTLQTARVSGVELTSDQLAQREQVRQTILAQQGDPDKVIHLNGSGTLEQQIEFEQRDATSQLLLNSLLEKAGVPSPHVTDAQVQQYYEAHRQEFGSLPGAVDERAGAWQRIDLQIRNKLAPQVQAEYQKGVQKYLEGLRANASVTVNGPNS